MRGPSITLRIALPLAVASGLAVVLAFPPFGLWWLAPFGVAALIVATMGQTARRASWLGLAHGAAFAFPLLHWTGTYVGALPWMLLGASQAMFFGAFGACIPVLTRWRWSAPPLAAAGWVAMEAARARMPFGGFPWGRLAFSQADGPFAHAAILGGAPAVSFVVALAGGCLALAATTRRADDGTWRRAIGPAAAVALALLALAVPTAQPTGPELVVAVVQGNVPRLGLEFNAQRRAVLDNHVNATIHLAADVAAGRKPRPDVVIWPENSSDIDPLLETDARAQIDRAARAIGVPILVGAVLDGPGRFVSNAGIVWDPATGPGARYVKRHPVPFAEYVPLRSLARHISSKVDLVRRDFVAGARPGVLELGPATIGDVICFEVAYDAIVRDTVTRGAGLLVVQTNNATFGRTAESAQQLAMVRLRAVEHGRFAVMASTSGVSAIVGPDGSVLRESSLFTRAVLIDRLRLGTSTTTVATRVGALPEYGLCAIAAVGLGVGAVVGAPRRRRKLVRRGHTATEGIDE